MSAQAWAVSAAARHFADTCCGVCGVELEQFLSLHAPLEASRFISAPAPAESSRHSTARTFSMVEGPRRSPDEDDFCQSPSEGWRME
jgi:hypothetical protein